MAYWRDKNSGDLVQIAAKDAGGSHTGSVAETDITASASGITIPANTIAVGDTLKLSGMVYVDNGSDAAPTGAATIRIRLTDLTGSVIVSDSVGSVGSTGVLTFNKSLLCRSATELIGSGNTRFSDFTDSNSTQILTVDITSNIVFRISTVLNNAADKATLYPMTIRLMKAA